MARCRTPVAGGPREGRSGSCCNFPRRGRGRVRSCQAGQFVRDILVRGRHRRRRRQVGRAAASRAGSGIPTWRCGGRAVRGRGQWAISWPPASPRWRPAARSPPQGSRHAPGPRRCTPRAGGRGSALPSGVPGLRLFSRAIGASMDGAVDRRHRAAQLYVAQRYCLAVGGAERRPVPGDRLDAQRPALHARLLSVVAACRRTVLLANAKSRPPFRLGLGSGAATQRSVDVRAAGRDLCRVAATPWYPRAHWAGRAPTARWRCRGRRVGRGRRRRCIL